MKPARLRPRAEQDLIHYIDHYRETMAGLGTRFLTAALSTISKLESVPSMGSPRFGIQCGIPRLRSMRIIGFPLIWFYLERPDYLDFVRLLHTSQDIFSILDEDAGA